MSGPAVDEVEKDNRDLVDHNTSQALTADDIEAMKASGKVSRHTTPHNTPGGWGWGLLQDFIVMPVVDSVAHPVLSSVGECWIHWQLLSWVETMQVCLPFASRTTAAVWHPIAGQAALSLSCPPPSFFCHVSGCPHALIHPRIFRICVFVNMPTGWW